MATRRCWLMWWRSSSAVGCRSCACRPAWTVLDEIGVICGLTGAGRAHRRRFAALTRRLVVRSGAFHRRREELGTGVDLRAHVGHPRTFLLQRRCRSPTHVHNSNACGPGLEAPQRSSNWSCPTATKTPSNPSYDNDQSIGRSPAPRQPRWPLLKGRTEEPRCADSGLVHAGDTGHVPAQDRLLDWASRPHRIATSGRSRWASARIACSVIGSHPCRGVTRPGATVSTRFIRTTPRCAQGPVAVRRLRDTEVVDEFGADADQARRQGRTSGATAKHRPIAWPGVGSGSRPTIRTSAASNG